MAMVGDLKAMSKACKEERRQYLEMKKDLTPIIKCRTKSSVVSKEMFFSKNKKRIRSHIVQDSIWKETTSWSELPDDLIEMVVSKMKSADDCARFRSVCMAWKYGFDKIRRLSLPRQLPLVVSQNGLPFRLHRVPELRGSSTSSCDLKLNNIPAGYRCIGSTEGWLVFVDHLGEYYDEWSSDSILLVNPLGEKHIRLPALKQYYKSPPPGTVNKVVLSANPTWNKGYVVMVIYGGYSKFAFYRSSDETWSKIGDQDFYSISDVIYYRNQIHIIEHSGCLFTVSNIYSSPVLEFVARQMMSEGITYQLYLVDLSGDLLLVRRENDLLCNTIGFEVFKMDPIEQVFTKVEDLGNHVIFLGSISSISVLASHFSGCHPNRIYFDRDYNTPTTICPGDMGYFCLNDGYLRQICTLKTAHVFFWMEPQVATSMK